MPKFTDSEPKIFTLLPAGDYTFRVIDFEIGLSNKGKTNGCEQYDVCLLAEGTAGKLDHFGKVMEQDACFWETFYDYAKSLWVLDTFLKSAGVKIPKDADYEFRQDVAQEKGILWVDPIGLRGHMRVKVEPWSSNAGKPVAEHKFSNRVSAFYTDREKLPRIESPKEDCPFGE
jgi:hypothetical protein